MSGKPKSLKNPIPRGRLADPNWEAELPPALEPKNVPTEDNVTKVRARCGACGFPYLALVLPWTPRIAKSVCPRRGCEHVTEIVTRDSTMDFIEEAHAIQEDRTRHSLNPKVFVGLDRASVADQRLRRRVKTKDGDAYLIG